VENFLGVMMASNNALTHEFKQIDVATNQENKKMVLEFQKEFENANVQDRKRVLENYTSNNYVWHGVYPFEIQQGPEALLDNFWNPLLGSWEYVQRRQDIFIAGESVFGGNWVSSMGHIAGMFERDWLGIPATGKMTFLRYCEFHKIENAKVSETYFHADLISVMQQAGVYPLPPQTGAAFTIPGPKTHDGLVLTAHDGVESAKTLELIQRMAKDLGENPEVDMAYDKLAETWHDSMIWYGPAGIGSTLSINGFKKQHQMPFRKSLYSTRKFNGHKSRFSEGLYGGWVGWPSLTMSVTGGGYMGLPATGKEIDMRVVDMYRREGDKIAENWVFIDIPYTLKQQDLDIFERMKQLVHRP
jgi:predicted ester cyclase